MKKIYLFILLIFGVSGVKCQTYYPMLDSVSNIWYFTINVQPLRVMQQLNCNYGNFNSVSSNVLVTIGDTLLNAIDYKIVMQQEYNQPFNDCVFGFIREDTTLQRVYFQDTQSGPEQLLYDFSMLQGDSMYIDFFNNFGYFTSGNYVLDSIGSVTIPAGVRRIFYLNNHNAPSQFPLEWIESVGHPGHTIYNKSANFWGDLFTWICVDNVSRDFYQLLTCYEHNSQKVYFDSCAHANAVNNWCFFYADSCDYFNICGSVEEVGAVSNFAVSPNPAQLSSQLIIDANLETRAEVVIFSMDGRQLYKSEPIEIHPGKNKFPLSTVQYRHGTYVVELKFKDGSIHKKMVVLN